MMSLIDMNDIAHRKCTLMLHRKLLMLIRPQQRVHFKLEIDVGLTATAVNRQSAIEGVISSVLGGEGQHWHRAALCVQRWNQAVLHANCRDRTMNLNRPGGPTGSRAIKEHSKDIVLCHVLSDEEERLFNQIGLLARTRFQVQITQNGINP